MVEAILRMIGRKAEAVLNRAVRYAVEQEHEYFTLEHVLWSLLSDRQMREMIQACGGDPLQIQDELETYLIAEIPRASKRSKEKESEDGNEKPLFSSDQSIEEEELEHPVATLSIQRLIQRALFHVQSSGSDEIQPLDLFIALFQAKDSTAIEILERQGIQRLAILNQAHLIKGNSSQSIQEPFHSESKAHSAEAASSSSDTDLTRDPLEAFAVNLNQMAKRGDLDPLIGRAAELDRTIQILCRRRKNNPIFVGEAGVGKTALAEGLAHRIVSQEVPAHLKNKVIYSLDISSLLAGAKFRGDFEQRFKKIVQAVEDHQEKGQQPLFFIDEIHTLIGAGSVGGGSLDAANLLKPLLARGNLQCMGATTFSEYRRIFEKDQALTRRFQKIEVSEPSFEESCEILKGLLPHYSKFHEVEYREETIPAAVRLSSQFLRDRFLPDKAIDVLDEAGAKAHLSSESTVNLASIEAVVAEMAKLPSRALDLVKRSKLKNLANELKMALFGQDLVIEGVTSSIHLAQAGLKSLEKPLGSFLFCGPTGVGKTELSKQLAHCLGIPLLRFDMSEYQEKHSISRLIGAPPGYIGFDQAGLLTEGISRNPYSIVLLDEIEKAHPEIWNTFLQIMDHGTLTDHNGRRADFRNALLIMTSNVGSQEMQRKPLGIQKSPEILASALKEVEKTFTPEFRNRLDQILFFKPLTKEAMDQVVSRQLAELESQLLKKSIEIQFDPSVSTYLTDKGYDPLMGARPLERLIQTEIKKPLSEEILFGNLQAGGSVKIGLSSTKKITFSIEITNSCPGLRVHASTLKSKADSRSEVS